MRCSRGLQRFVKLATDCLFFVFILDLGTVNLIKQEMQGAGMRDGPTSKDKTFASQKSRMFGSFLVYRSIRQVILGLEGF